MRRLRCLVAGLTVRLPRISPAAFRGLAVADRRGRPDAWQRSGAPVLARTAVTIANTMGYPLDCRATSAQARLSSVLLGSGVQGSAPSPRHAARTNPCDEAIS